ncbi:MAG: hypothetical protein AB7K04_14635, partial [Pseudorhodoplanes sp.]
KSGRPARTRMGIAFRVVAAVPGEGTAGALGAPRAWCIAAARAALAGGSPFEGAAASGMDCAGKTARERCG